MTAMRTNQEDITIRLCRDYEPQGVIPLQTDAGLESWLEAGGGDGGGGDGGVKGGGGEGESKEAKEQSGKAWAARLAAELPLK